MDDSWHPQKDSVYLAISDSLMRYYIEPRQFVSEYVTALVFSTRGIVSDSTAVASIWADWLWEHHRDWLIEPLRWMSLVPAVRTKGLYSFSEILDEIMNGQIHGLSEKSAERVSEMDGVLDKLIPTDDWKKAIDAAVWPEHMGSRYNALTLKHLIGHDPPRNMRDNHDACTSWEWLQPRADAWRRAAVKDQRDEIVARAKAAGDKPPDPIDDLARGRNLTHMAWSLGFPENQICQFPKQLFDFLDGLVEKKKLKRHEAAAAEQSYRWGSEIYQHNQGEAFADITRYLSGKPDELLMAMQTLPSDPVGAEKEEPRIVEAVIPNPNELIKVPAHLVMRIRHGAGRVWLDGAKQWAREEIDDVELDGRFHDYCSQLQRAFPTVGTVAVTWLRKRVWDSDLVELVPSGVETLSNVPALTAVDGFHKLILHNKRRGNATFKYEKQNTTISTHGKTRDTDD